MSDELPVGTRIRVAAGVTAPELPDISIEDWTETITELTGKKANHKYIIAWDASTIKAMPSACLQQCREKQLYHLMASLTADDIEPAGEEIG